MMLLLHLGERDRAVDRSCAPDMKRQQPREYQNEIGLRRTGRSLGITPQTYANGIMLYDAPWASFLDGAVPMMATHSGIIV